MKQQPSSITAHLGRGLALRGLQRHAEAVASFDAVLALEPTHFDVLYRRGNSLVALGRPGDALRSYDAALAVRPDHIDALYNRGLALQSLNRAQEAIASYDKALSLSPDDAEALNNRGNACLQIRRHAEALSSYEKALRLSPNMPDALLNKSVALLELKLPAKATASLRQLLEVAPDYPFAKGKLLHARMLACDWTDLDRLLLSVSEDLQRDKPAADPFGLQGVCDDPALQRRCAQIYTNTYHPAARGVYASAAGQRGTRIRIGYVSGEFRQQATSVLAVQLIERHDRSRFEVVAFDNGWDDGSPMRRRLEAAFDEMLSINHLSDHEAAAAIAARGIDILVDLNGFFGLARQGVFALRPSPIQVNYLGFPGTLGASYMDYIVADRHVIPPEHEQFYVERVVCLPDSYQPNDGHRAISSETPTRAELQLPESGFVFCCFNNNYKITPAIFDVWMRLLRSIDGSMLWLLQDNPAVVQNLRREAERRGVEASRLVFAPRMPLEAHLARHGAAGLFLDTLPSNAHTTASDALWAGLPLLTCRGGSFTGRVASSLLHAAGLPELVTHDLPQYEALALALARDPERLGALRERLVANRHTCALFDTERYCRHLETAYATMHARGRQGEPHRGFSVDRIA